MKDLKNLPVYLVNKYLYLKEKKLAKRYLWSHFEEKLKLICFQNMKIDFHAQCLFFFERRCLIKNKFNENLVGKEDRYWANLIIKKNKIFLTTLN